MIFNVESIVSLVMQRTKVLRRVDFDSFVICLNDFEFNNTSNTVKWL